MFSFLGNIEIVGDDGSPTLGCVCPLGNIEIIGDGMLPTLGFPPDRGAFTLPSLERFHNIHAFLELPAFTSLNYKFFNPLNVII